MNFEYDPAKSKANKTKHGIDFEEAQALWNDESVVMAQARFVSEPRSIAVGRIGRKYWAAVFARRGDTVRLISVRRARKKEIQRYENR